MINKLYGISESKAKELLDYAKSHKEGDKSGTNSTAYINGDYVLLKTDIIANPLENGDILFDSIVFKLKELYDNGVNVVPILGYVYDENKIETYQNKFASAYVFEDRAKGEELWQSNLKYDSDGKYSNESEDYIIKQSNVLSNIPQKHFDKWVKDFRAIWGEGLVIDPSKKANFFYDEKKGFSFIDLNAFRSRVAKTEEEKQNEFESSILYMTSVPVIPFIYGGNCTNVDIEKLKNVNLSILKKCVIGLINDGIDIATIKKVVTEKSCKFIMGADEDKLEELFGDIEKGDKQKDNDTER